MLLLHGHQHRRPPQLIQDFERSLRAANKSPKTVKIYEEAARSMILR